MRVSSLAAGILLTAMPALAGESGAAPVTGCPEKGGNYTGVALKGINIDYSQAARWNGCVIPWTVDPGTVVVVKVQNANKKRYRIKIGSEVHPRKPDEAEAAFLAYLGQAPGKQTEEQKNERAKADAAAEAIRSKLGITASLLKSQAENCLAALNEWEELLTKFRNQDEALSGRVDALSQAARASTTAATFCALRKDLGGLLSSVLDKADQAKCPGPVDCSDALNPLPSLPECADALQRVPKSLDEDLAALDRTVTSFTFAQQPAGTTEIHKNLLSRLEERARLARQAVKSAPEVLRGLAAFYSDPKGAEGRLFETVKSVRVTDDPVDIVVSVDSGDEKDPVTEFSVRLAVTPPSPGGFAFSTGVVFTGLVDHSYAVRDGSIVRTGSEDWLRPGIGVLTHWRFGSAGRVAASVGFAGKDGDLQYLGGLSWLFGSRQRFVVTGGFAVGGVDRLDRVEEGDPWREDTAPVRSSTEISWLFGLTFKF